MLVTALLTAHVNRWVIQLSSYCAVNELGSAAQLCVLAPCVCARVRVCVSLQSQTEAQRTDGEFRRRLTHRNQAITHSMTPPDVREEQGEGRKLGERQERGRVLCGEEMVVWGICGAKELGLSVSFHGENHEEQKGLTDRLGLRVFTGLAFLYRKFLFVKVA